MATEQQVMEALQARSLKKQKQLAEKALTEEIVETKIKNRTEQSYDTAKKKAKCKGVKKVKCPVNSRPDVDTISMGYDRFLEILPGDTWKYLPHTFASVMSDGLWKPYPYLVMISNIMATVIARGGGRVLISVPPRHGKSFFISQWLPVWFLANWPHKRVLLSTYEANFAATWGRRARNIVKEKGARVGLYLAEDATASNNWATTAGGGMVTAGVGGPITGKGADLGIIDDPHKNWQEANSETTLKMIHEWFDSTFYTRLEPGGTVVILHTRWNENDLIGYLLREKTTDGWFSIRIPAIAEDWNGEEDVLGRAAGEALCPQRYDTAALNRIRSNMTPMMWNALFQQRPAPMEGSIFIRSKWKYYTVRPKCNFILQSWDTASKKNWDSAYSVCQTWGVSELGAVLLDQWRDKVEYPQLRRQVEVQYLKYRPNVILIEDRDSGQALCQALQQETILPVLPVMPTMDKVIRAQAVSPMQESGRCWLPDPTLQENLWVGEFVDNAATFPNAFFKDEIDSMSQALAYIMNMAMSGRVMSSEKRRTSKLIEGFRDLM